MEAMDRGRVFNWLGKLIVLQNVKSLITLSTLVDVIQSIIRVGGGG